MLLRGLLGVLLLATTFACGEAASDTEGAMGEWGVAGEPRLAVGDVAERDTLVFGRISDARLLAGGLLVVAQEVHWMTAQAYTAHADSLQVAMPEGARFRVLEATKRGWRGVGWFEATGYTCGMIIGMTPPIGWSEGEVRCGWG